ncbi:acyltransferase [Leifsonia sp. F6_8S_P_1B]|uniref:Acyltransferase n=1 Tax=Leifsonia williamsii TaxID=3035919 RepID=A0ABT8KAD3_9MICO|nr:acyltransferase [Leifsonia williamsii]MDN4614410.1 acyltransferase [Leifsonia williamsii]
MTSPALLRPTGRLTSLDGVRGVAALVVLAHHVSLLYAPIASTYIWGSGPTPHAGSVSWWLSYTPLKLFTAGPEAVMVFFVLSGLVLTLPVLRPRPFDWMAYFPRRLVRIGLPVVASILFATALALLVPQIPRLAVSAWVASTSVNPVTFERFMSVLDPTVFDFGLNNPLWSLYYEMIFSVTLPLFIGLALLLKRWWPLGLAAAVASVAIGLNAVAGGFHYLPAFFVGALAAVLLGRIHGLGERINGWRAGWLLWIAVLVVSLLLLIGPWLFPTAYQPFRVVLAGFQPVAALGIVLVCLEWAPLSNLLSRQPFAWAGKVSFSLYLVHVPIILTMSYLLRGLPLPVVAAVSVVLALVVAPLFYTLVEKRAHTLSKRVGDLVTRVFAARSGVQEPALDRQP